MKVKLSNQVHQERYFTNPQNNITRLLVESHFGQLLDENAWQTTTS